MQTTFSTKIGFKSSLISGYRYSLVE